MSSKIRLDDLPIESLDDMDNEFFSGRQADRVKRDERKKRKRQMIEDYMDERSLKRRISDAYDMI